MAGKFRGVTRRGDAYQISFTYNGERCRERLRFPDTKKGEAAANHFRGKILMEIDMGTFEYATTFPKSKRALRHSQIAGRHITIEEALKQYLRDIANHKAPSTIKDYGHRIHAHLIPVFGAMTLEELRASDVRSWQNKMCEHLSPKSINNTLTPLREVFNQAYADELIETNAMSRVPNLPFQTREPKPFSRDEVMRILKGFTNDAAEVRNYFQFAFATGLRTSELIALTWEDIDLDKRQVSVSKAYVVGRLKAPKTNAGKRFVDLSGWAIEAILDQSEIHGRTGTLFRDPRDAKPWKNDQALRKIYWYPNLKVLGIEQRNPYQTRHTFASQLLSDGEPPIYVASQLGHANCNTLFSAYGRWIN